MSGGADKHKPANFVRLDTTQALIAEVQGSDVSLAIRVVHGGRNNGTYACRELVIAYASWISAAFHLKVIHVFLASVQEQPSMQPELPLAQSQQTACTCFRRHESLQDLVERLAWQLDDPNGYSVLSFMPLYRVICKKLGHGSKMLVDRQKLVDLHDDLEQLRSRVSAMGVLASDVSLDGRDNKRIGQSR